MSPAPRVVVDTSVVSIIHNNDTRAPYYEQRIAGRRSFISLQTLEELWFGAYNRNWGDRARAKLAEHLHQYEVVWATQELIHISARLRSDRRSAGRELKSADAWIAATAILLKCPLASHDGHFANIPGIELLRSEHRSER